MLPQFINRDRDLLHEARQQRHKRRMQFIGRVLNILQLFLVTTALVWHLYRYYSSRPTPESVVASLLSSSDILGDGRWGSSNSGNMCTGWICRGVAAFFFLISYLGWLSARIQLMINDGFGVLPEPSSRNLVTSGPYALFRHPIYIFSTIALVGFLIIIEQQQYLIYVFLVLIPLQIVRACLENRKLYERFGDEYRHYKSKAYI